MSDYLYRSEGTDQHGFCIWSCTREGSGICGYGPTMEMALEAFLDLEQELVPLPTYELSGLGRSDQPPEAVPVPYVDPDRAYDDYREETA